MENTQETRTVECPKCGIKATHTITEPTSELLERAEVELKEWLKRHKTCN